LYAPFTIEYANKLTEKTISTKFWGLQIDNHLNWKKKSQIEYCMFCSKEIVPSIKNICSEDGVLCTFP